MHYLHACDVFVLPSILRSEAFGIVFLETMACGKPVVSTELSTGTSFVNQHQKTGLVVPPNDATALAQALNDLLANAEIRDKYGKAGRERVEKYFSKEKMIANIVTTYQSVYEQSINRSPPGKKPPGRQGKIPFYRQEFAFDRVASDPARPEHLFPSHRL